MQGTRKLSLVKRDGISSLHLAFAIKQYKPCLSLVAKLSCLYLGSTEVLVTYRWSTTKIARFQSGITKLRGQQPCNLNTKKTLPKVESA